MSRLKLKIADKQLCNHNAFFVRDPYGKEFYICVYRTASYKLTLKDIKGKSYDKCSMSYWFKSYDYFSIFWDEANKEEMIDTIIKELREELYK